MTEHDRELGSLTVRIMELERRISQTEGDFRALGAATAELSKIVASLSVTFVQGRGVGQPQEQRPAAPSPVSVVGISTAGGAVAGAAVTKLLSFLGFQ